MKKTVSIILSAALIFVMAGCEADTPSGRMSGRPTGIRDVIESRKAAEISKGSGSTVAGTSETTFETTTGETVSVSGTSGRKSGVDESAPAPSETVKAKKAKSSKGIDVDLTGRNANMVYAEVYNMMVKPEDYIGKTVKMKGKFAQYKDEATGKRYFACIISDAMACCSQGIEFVLTKKYKYPKDYPKEGETISVVGVFETYKEGKDTYCTLVNAKLV